MSRTQTTGISYFPFDVDFFSDKKVKILKARYGADGIAVYIYILCQIYRDGYYTRVDDDLKFIISDEFNMSSDKVEQIILFLFERSMFNEQLLKSDDVITCTGIQRRWQDAIKTRASKTPVTVEDKLWLLGAGETKPYIKVTKKDNSSEKKAYNSEKKAYNSEKKAYKVEESKVEESKVEESKVEEEVENYNDMYMPTSSTASIKLPELYILQLHETYPGFDFVQVFKEIRLKLIATNYPCQSERQLCTYITAWFRNLAIDREKAKIEEKNVTTGVTSHEAESLNRKIRTLTIDDI